MRQKKKHNIFRSEKPAVLHIRQHSKIKRLRLGLELDTKDNTQILNFNVVVLVRKYVSIARTTFLGNILPDVWTVLQV